MTTGGGPNGLAVGPDAALYLCNTGGFLFQTIAGINRAKAGTHPDDTGGRLRTAYVTLSGTGQLIAMGRPDPGLALA